MTVIELLSRLRERQVELVAAGDRLRLRAPEGALTPELREELSRRKAEILELIANGNAGTRRAAAPLRRVPRTSNLPLSFAQERFWFLEQLQPGTSANHITFGLRFKGDLQVEAVRASLQAIVDRHEVLRTTVNAGGGRARQVVTEALRLEIPLVDVPGGEEASRVARANARALEFAHRPFDLERGPLFRAEILRLDERDHILVLAVHHLAFDGWSVGILAGEFAALYQAFAAGRPSPLAPLNLQYADFAARQRELVRSGALDAQLDYWKRQLADLTTLELSTDRPRPKARTFQGAQALVSLDEPLTAALEALARREGATLFMVLLAACQTLLHRYSGQDDIVVGTAIAGRNHADVEPLVGPFINSLVMRGDLSGDPAFSELLRRVRGMALDAYAHQDLPFERLVDELQPDRDLSRNPLFQIIFALQNTPLPRLDFGDLSLSVVNIERTTSASDIDWLLWRVPDGIKGFIRYSTELFDAGTIDRMVGHYETLLRAIAENPARRVSELPILRDDERRRILVDWNRTDAPCPTESLVHELVARHAAACPEAVAASGRGGSLTYGELNARARRLAQWLRSAGVRAGAPVAVFMERSPDMLVALLGTLNAGAAYVPIDPNCPGDRLAFMLEDTDARVVLTEARLRDRLPEHARGVLCLDRDWSRVAATAEIDLPAFGADALAYVIYTSGSTGRPKGVEIAHAGLLNLVHWHHRRYAITAADRATQVANVAFDASVWEIWPYLAAGARVCFPDPDTVSVPAHLWRWLADERITLTFLPTPLAEAMLREPLPPGLALRALLTGGDKLRQGVPANLPFEVVNHYGPTENSVVATCATVEAAGPEAPAPPIGRPIDNVQAYVLDRRRQPVPVGVPGELYLGGASLARGYLRRPELTAERFVPSPFGPPDSRLYRTGDLVRYLPDGNLQFLGRNDDQVKVRGFRIELGEIEQALRQHPAVAESVVIVREYSPGDRRLLGYVTPRETHAQTDRESLVSEVRAAARQRLPEYMVPAAILVLDRLPLTANGKLDRRALPDPDAARRDTAATLELARTPAEKALAGVWARVLHVEQAGIHENFFDLGGDSILSLQIVAGAAEHGMRLTPRDIFEYPTIAELAARVPMTAAAPPVPAAASGPAEGAAPLTPIQHWFFDQAFADPSHFNQAALLEPRVKLDASLLEQAVRHLLEHHDALRFRYEQEGGAWRQVYESLNGHVPLSRVDLRSLNPAEQAAAIAEGAARAQASFDLAGGPLVKAVLFDLGPETDRLLIVAHHLVVDTVSWRILLSDLQRAYDQLSRHEPVRLPGKTASFGAWAERLREHARTLVAEAPHWESLASAPVVRCPRDRDAGENTVASTRTVSVSLDAADTRRLLQDVPKVYGTRINEVLLTAVARSFARWTGAETLLVDLEGHGRESLFEDLDLTQTVGWFTTVFPVLLDLRGAGDVGTSLKQIKEQIRRVPSNGIGFGLLRYLAPDPQISARLGRLPRPEVGFNYLGQFDNVLDGALFKPAAEASGPPVSPRARRVHAIEISGRVIEGRLHMTYLYSENLHAQATIERLAGGFVEAIRDIVRHCQSPEAGGFTPSDFPEARVNQEQLDKLLGRLSGAGRSRR